ncbi:MAG: S-methyl-5'-thioadenosine phosphorylase [Thermofilum sp. ex4484_15]|nr:MAG: S-methyl-5'-thioadenosine phosphorylase [Thermofilum sp. ex4484_15]
MLPVTRIKAEVGIIGGSGLYSVDFLRELGEEKISTPYGPPSSPIKIADFKGLRIAFLPRHGSGHVIPPHKINYRANIWALKELGVKAIISVSAVGSLREDYKPGDFVCPDQFIDMTKNREYTFFDGPLVCHFSMADPFCEPLRRLIIGSAKRLGIKIHEGGTYLVIEGPRFSTRAESMLWRKWGADIVGMTLVPEVTLAREVGICYANVSMVTDYDVWAEKPVTAEEVIKVMSENVKKCKLLIKELLTHLVKEGLKALEEDYEELLKRSCVW